MQLLMSVTIYCNASREIKLYKILPDGIWDAPGGIGITVVKYLNDHDLPDIKVIKS